MSEPTPLTSNDASLDNAGAPKPMGFGGNLMVNLFIPLGLLAAAGLVVVMLGKVEPEKRPDPDTTRTGRLRALPAVRVAELTTLESTGKQLRLRVDGTVVPYREARVAAEVSGRVVFKADECEAGSYVTEGQLLMKIDGTDYELEVQRLARQRDQDYQSLREIDQEVANAQRLIDVAEEDQALQQGEVDRLKRMPAGFASRAEVDQANRALLASRQTLVNSQNQRDLLKQRRIRLESQRELAETQLKVAEINLQRCEIRAPIEGVIVNEDADLNTFVNRGTLLVTIDDTSKVDVASNLRMDQLYWILDQDNGTSGSSSRGYDLPETPAIVEYELSGREGIVYRWKGRLMSYNGIGLDETTRTVPVRIVVDDPTQYVDAEGQVHEASGATALVRGMYVRVHLLIQPKSRLVVVPSLAMQPGNRVFHFLPDESVIQFASGDAPAGNAQLVSKDDLSEQSAVEESSDPESKADSDAGGRVLDGDNFDPNAWKPGRVMVRTNVNPVDSLSIGLAGPNNGESDQWQQGKSSKLWVCEVSDDQLKSGSLVVVSPIGTIDNGELPVRAQLVDDSRETPIEAVAEETSAAASEPTASTADRVLEDA